MSCSPGRQGSCVLRPRADKTVERRGPGGRQLGGHVDPSAVQEGSESSSDHGLTPDDWISGARHE